MPALAVVVPLLKQDQAYLPDLLKALSQQTQPPTEVIVCGAADGEVESFGLPLRCLPNPPESISIALNRAIAATESDFIVRLDVRARPAPDYLQQCLVTVIQTQAAVVGGRLDIVPDGLGAVAAAIALAVGHPLGAGDALYRLNPAHSQSVDTVPYPCFRKSLWHQLGGFNESLLANEDYEFNWRVRQPGGRILLNPALCTRYLARPTLKLLTQQYFRYGWWKWQMLRQHPRSLRWRQAVPVLALGGFAFALGLGLSLSLWWPLGLLLALYLSLVLMSSGQLAMAQSAWRLAFVLPAVFIAIHFAWSSGAWINLLTAGRWLRR